jgi:hypothetical protein
MMVWMQYDLVMKLWTDWGSYFLKPSPQPYIRSRKISFFFLSRTVHSGWERISTNLELHNNYLCDPFCVQFTKSQIAHFWSIAQRTPTTNILYIKSRQPSDYLPGLFSHKRNNTITTLRFLNYFTKLKK